MDCVLIVINSCYGHYNISVIGCLFHWKQALRRKLLKIKFETSAIDRLLMRDIIEVLTVIPHNKPVRKWLQSLASHKRLPLKFGERNPVLSVTIEVGRMFRSLAKVGL